MFRTMFQTYLFGTMYKNTAVDEAVAEDVDAVAADEAVVSESPVSVITAERDIDVDAQTTCNPARSVTPNHEQENE